MRQWNVRNRLDFQDIEHSQIGLPLLIPIQRIIIRAQVFRETVAVDRLLEHPAKRRSVNGATLNAEPNDPPRTLVHH